MSSQANKYITPVENTAITHAISNYLNIKTHGNQHATWDSIITIIDTTGNHDLIKELQPFIHDVEHAVTAIMTRRNYTVSDEYNKRRQVSTFLKGKNREFYQKVMLALSNHGYLVKRPPDIPRNF